MIETIIQSKEVITRKEHRCFACQCEFPSKTKMHCGVYKEDGDIYTIYICATCNEILTLLDDPWGDGYQEGCVLDEISQTPGVETPEELLELFKKEKEAAK
jgi:DNA-directed RNA polymerase subunit RPC12/RpoP